MERGVSHDFSDESIEAKARWFRALPLDERWRIFLEWTSLALELNPQIGECKDAQPIPGRVQVLERT